MGPGTERMRHRSSLGVQYIGQHYGRSLVNEGPSFRLSLTAGRPGDQRHSSL